MVQIKAGLDAAGRPKPGGGGHGPFETARQIDAFSARTLRYKGKLDDGVLALASGGALLELDLTSAKIGAAGAATLASALQSPECRLRVLG